MAWTPPPQDPLQHSLQDPPQDPSQDPLGDPLQDPSGHSPPRHPLAAGGDAAVPEPYLTVGRRARFYKALAQMVIGVIGVVIIVLRLGYDLAIAGETATTATDHVFSYIGLTLAVAAAVELAYTLFTYGADEALNPILLAVAAAMLLQLGKVGQFRLQEGLALLLYAVALAGLLAVDRFLIVKHEPATWIPHRWRRRSATPDRDERLEPPG